MNDDVVYRSTVRIEREGGTHRTAYLPASDEPVKYGVHSEIAEHYGIAPKQETPRAATIDHMIAAAAGWLTGTFAGALAARQVHTGDDRWELRSEATGEIELEDDVLVIKRIQVEYFLEIEGPMREVIERVNEMHADHCPIARSIDGCIDISTRVLINP